ncbi:MFS transporter [Veronia nyctiphanis]|uniref:MFS transporter n=2 Tax=Veronia nyctiphanis TaxID=1278244 RepID=A0A4Q0YTT8_9GAMM|nr:MFS transporter [Veronia nyctiphanis]
MKARSIPYLTGQIFDGMSSGLMMLALPWAMLSEVDRGPFVAMTALVCTIISFLTTPVSSTIIDRYSRKAILLATQAAKLTSALFILLLFSVDLGSVWLLAGFQLVLWVVNDIAWANHSAFIQENYQKSEYPKISGHREITMHSTSLITGVLGILLLEHWTMVQFSLLTSLLFALAQLCFWRTPYQRKVTGSEKRAFSSQILESKSVFMSSPRFFLFVLLSCLGYPMLTYLARLVPIYVSEIGISGTWFASWNMAFAIGGILMGFSINWILKRTAHEHAMTSSVLMLSALLFLISYQLSPTVLIALTVGIGFFNALNRVARTNLLHVTIPMNMRGRVDGGLKLFSTSAQGISYVIIALLSSYNVTNYGFLIAAIVMLIAGLGMLSLSRSQILSQSILSQ